MIASTFQSMLRKPAAPTSGGLPGLTSTFQSLSRQPTAPAPAPAPAPAAPKPAGAVTLSAPTGQQTTVPKPTSTPTGPVLGAPTTAGVTSVGGAMPVLKADGGAAPAGVPLGKGAEATGATVNATGAPGAVGSGHMLPELAAEARRQLAQPTAYDDDLFQSTVNIAKQRLDESGNAAQRDLDASLARRGLGYGATYAGKLSDLKTQRERSFAELMNPIMRERAQALGSGRASAFNNAMGVSQYGDSLAQRASDDAYRNFLTQEQLRQARESQFMQLLFPGLTYGMQGLQGMGMGINGMQNAGAGYGQQAAANSAMWGQLGSLIPFL